MEILVGSLPEVRSMKRLGIVLPLLVLALPARPALAGSLQPTTYFESYYTAGYWDASSQAGTLTRTEVDPDGSTSYALASATPGTVKADASASGPGGYAWPNADIQGSFEVHPCPGCNPSILVPLIVSLSGYATVSGSAESGIQAWVEGVYEAGYTLDGWPWALAWTVQFSGCVESGGFTGAEGPCPSPTGSFVSYSISQTMMVLPDTVGTIELAAGDSVRTGTMPALPDIDFGSFSAATAFLDPLIEIDPTFLTDNPGYSIEFSPGFLGPSPVPEPTSGLLLVTGLLGLGTMVLRRRQA
ncbi:MAG: PEP-CTERM sorting domain-containing protein [Bryobacteraceae bacterium]|jgi:hypothetical protein